MAISAIFQQIEELLFLFYLSVMILIFHLATFPYTAIQGQITTFSSYLSNIWSSIPSVVALEQHNV